MRYRLDFKHFLGVCHAILFNDHGCGYAVFGLINHKLGTTAEACRTLPA